MTYILGIQKTDNNFAAILCDLMVTFKDHEGNVIERNNTSLKSGLLFEGCIYGAAGNANLAKSFIKGFKELTDSSRSIEYNWELFQNYSKADFADNSGEAFKVLLSCRVSGVPQLFLYNSTERNITKIDDGICSIGSGKEILDKHVELRKDITDKAILEILSKNKIPILYYPYFYCLWLSELTMGLEASKLNDIGVGGLFHFCFQTNEKECRQQPSVYVLSVPDKKNKTIYNHIYRVTFVEMSLVVDNPLFKPSRSIIMPFEMSKTDNISKDELQAFGEKVNQEADAQPFYYFCGFGFPTPELRGSFTAHLSCDRTTFVVDKKGTIHPDYRSRIERNIDSVQNVPGPPLSIIERTLKT